ncbi:LacI family DNA-binding transcriptional regulator [Ningiella sp. W23]|uniref:LacI family DNA-binding transcriptional regulator n=1 Tax=Ningiella sp. W23 TaxID=3023715 RepID=UPI003757771F
MSNIKKVSELAGVSTATVTRTLKSPELVKPKTREKVLRAVRESGYRPNAMATVFKRGRANSIVVLVPKLVNPFFMNVIEGVQTGAKKHGYTVLLGDTKGKSELENQYASMVLNGRADGLIQLDYTFPFSKDDTELGQNAAIVSVCDRIGGYKFPFVELDNFGAARALTHYLIELEHTRIGIISGQRASQIYFDRFSGIARALAEDNIVFEDELMVGDHASFENGREGIKTLMALDSPPTAVICFSDDIAIGAMFGAKELGLSIPKDISITGFDDNPVSQYFDPSLTTIKQPAAEMGERAVNMLIQIIDGNPPTRLREVLPFELVIRDSTGPAAH